MSKATFNYRKLIALCAVMAIILVQSGKLSKATSPPVTAPDLNLGPEKQTLDSYFDDLVKHDQKRIEFGKRSSLTQAEFNSLKGEADDLKRRASQVQNAIREIIRKLKEAGQWDELDTEVLAKTNDEKFRSLLRENGGLKHILEEAASQFSSQAGDIDAPLSGLRSKIARAQDPRFDPESNAQMGLIPAGFSEPEPAPMLKKTFRCIGSAIRVAVHLVADGTTGKAGPAHRCYCFDECGGASTTSE